MGDEYFLWANEQRQGPFTIEQIVDMIDAGQIDMRTLMARNTSKFNRASYWLGEIDEARRIKNYVPPIPRTPEQARKHEVNMAVLLGCLVAFGIFFLIPVYSSRNATSAYDDRSEEREAYKIAQKFVERSFPEAHVYSDQNNSVIKPHGDYWDVAFVVDGKNGFGGPLRKAVVVSMYKSGDRWTCEGIHQEGQN